MAHLDSLVDGNLLVLDVAVLLKVLLALLLLGSLEVGRVGRVAFLGVTNKEEMAVVSFMTSRV